MLMPVLYRVLRPLASPQRTWAVTLIVSPPEMRELLSQYPPPSQPGQSGPDQRNPQWPQQPLPYPQPQGNGYQQQPPYPPQQSSPQWQTPPPPSQQPAEGTWQPPSQPL